MTIAAHNPPCHTPPRRCGEIVDPVYRQIRDLVYKVSGIYKADEKLYLLADGCGRRMKETEARTRANIGITHRATHRDGEFANC